MMSTQKEVYQQKFEAQLDEWQADIDKIKAKAKKADADARIAYEDKLMDLRNKQAAAREKLVALKASSESAWEDLRVGIDNAWGALGTAVESARSRFL